MHEKLSSTALSLLGVDLGKLNDAFDRQVWLLEPTPFC